MNETAVPPETAPPAPGPEAPTPSRGAWAGVLVVAYAALASTVNGALLAVLLPVHSALDWTALDIERQAYDQGGVEGVVDLGNAVRTTWAAVEPPLLFTGLGGTLLALAVLAFGLGVVVGRERARVAARVAVALRAAHEVVAAVWVGVAVLPDLGAHTEAIFGALRAAAEEAGQIGRIPDPPAFLTGSALPWASAIGAAVHVLVLVYVFRLLGRPHVREWCARRTRGANREGAPAVADAPSRE